MCVCVCGCVLTLFFRQGPLHRQVFPCRLNLVWSYFPNLSTHTTHFCDTPAKNTESDFLSPPASFSVSHSIITRLYIQDGLLNIVTVDIICWPAPQLLSPPCSTDLQFVVVHAVGVCGVELWVVGHIQQFND